MDIDVKTAIEHGDAQAMGRLLLEDPSLANALIRWGNGILTHPLHYVCDMLFEGKLAPGKEPLLIDALIQAGADLDFQRDREDGQKSDTPLIGAASLAAEQVGLRLLDAGARPELRGIFGETALHWAALLGEDRLAERLISGSDIDLKDEKYHSSPLGWAIHGWQNPQAGSRGKQCEVAAMLVRAGAKVESEWLESADAAMLAALRPA